METAELKERFDGEAALQHSFRTGLEKDRGPVDLSMPRGSVSTMSNTSTRSSSSMKSADEKPASVTPTGVSAAATIATTLLTDAGARRDLETVSSRTNSFRGAHFQSGDMSLTVNSLSLPPQSLVANTSGHSPNDSIQPFQAALNAAAVNGTTGAGVGAGDGVAAPPSFQPDPREPLVLQAAYSASFKRLNGHVKVVSRLTLCTISELLPVLFNPQVVLTDMDKVRCVSARSSVVVSFLMTELLLELI